MAGNPDVMQDQFTYHGRPMPHLPGLRLDLDALHATFKQKSGNASLQRLIRIGYGKDELIGHRRIRNQALIAVDPVAVAIGPGTGGKTAQIGAGLGFGHGQSRDPFTRTKTG